VRPPEADGRMWFWLPQLCARAQERQEQRRYTWPWGYPRGASRSRLAGHLRLSRHRDPRQSNDRWGHRREQSSAANRAAWPIVESDR